jgi:DNA-binding winged helix-turn-helix (wHTH) protein
LVEVDELDALRFLALSHDGQEALAHGDAETAAEALRDALALWRGPVLGGEPIGPTEPAARRLESLRATAAAAQVEAEQAVAREGEHATEVAALAGVALRASRPSEETAELPPPAEAAPELSASVPVEDAPGPAEPETADRLDFRILGELDVRVGGHATPALTAGQRALLGTLLLHANEAVPRETLARMLWPNDTVGTAARRLNAQVTGLGRKLTGEGDDRRLIESRPEGYVLLVETDELDALRFLSLSQEGQEALAHGDAERAAEALRDALALWRGPVLGGEPIGPAEPAARRLESLREAAAAAQVEAEQAVEHERAAEAAPAGMAPIPTPLPAPAAEPSGAVDLYDSPRPAEQHAAGGARRRWRSVVPFVVGLLGIAVVGVAGFLLLRDDAARVAATPPPPTSVPIAVEPNTVVELDPSSGKVRASFPVGVDPDEVALAGNAVWVLNGAAGTVSRVDLEGGDVETIDSVPEARGLAASDTEGVWVAGYEAPAVRRLAQAGFSGSPAVPMRPEVGALSLGGGYLWVVNPTVEEGAPETVSLVDASTADIAGTAPIGADSRFVAFGHGIAWISSQRDDTITTVSTSGEAETFDVGPGPSGIAVTEDAVWVAHFWNDELWRLDPDTKQVVARIPVGQGAYDVKAGLGAIWVTSVDSRTITRVDPQTNSVSATFQLTFPAQKLAIGDDTVWATIRSCGSPIHAC